jgi:PAS domain S-box-containing protein
MLVAADGACLGANPAAARILGLDRRALLACRLPEPWSRAGRTALEALRTGAPLRRQPLAWHREEGDSLWLELSVEPLAEGGALVSFEDITERKRLESALEGRILALACPGEGERITFHELFDLADIQRLQDSLAQALGVASLITQPDGTPITEPSNFTPLCRDLIRTSPKGCENCFRSDSLVGRVNPDGPIVQKCLSGGLWDAGASIVVGGHHIANWLVGQVRDATWSLAAMAAYARDIGVGEQAFLAAYAQVPAMAEDRVHKLAEAVFVAARHLSDTAYLNLQQARFIAERHAAQEEIVRLNRDLERRVLERTAQLEAANRELEAFSYSVSHDLRAPLRSIDGFSQALQEDCEDRLDAGGRHYLERIRHGTRHMGALIDDLLKLSRTGRSELVRGDCDLSGLCRQVLDELAAADPRRRVQVVLQPGLRIWADPSLMEVVLENLLGNAWKFSARNPQARIEVTAAVAADTGRVFRIRDNGAGFDMAQAGKLFSPFHRLHAAADFEGTGIGLALVQRILRRHGGRVWAEAEPGVGACFSFTLPAGPEEGPG